MVLSLGLGRMISSPQHLRLQSIEVGSEACLVHLDVVKGLLRSSLECTGRRGTRGLMLMMHALRLPGINIPKNALLPSQLPVPVSSSEEEDMDGIEEEDGHDSEEVHYDVREEDGREQDHWNANGDEVNEVYSDSRSPMLDTIDKLTEPTVCSLLDGTVELALAKVFPSQKAFHSVPV
jgi:hypothetical protein